MRTLLLTALAVAMAAAIRYPDYQDDWDYSTSGIRGETVFRPGVEYHYRYESQVLTGIKATSDQVSGVKIHAKVRMQHHRDGTTLLKMQHVSIYQVHDVTSRQLNDQILPDEQLTRLTGEQAEAMTEQLTKPIKCRFVEGEVREVKSSRSDKYWSINIKKGLLSLLQLKLTGKSMHSGDSDSYLESSRPRQRFQDAVSPFGGRRQSSRWENTFKVMESDVNGECETKYFIKNDKSEESSSSNLRVTKVKNFDQCLTKNSFTQGLFAGLPHYSSEKKLIQPSMEAEYELSGDRHHYLIKKAALQAKYLFRPYGAEGGHICTHVVQKLHLMATEDIQNPISVENLVSEKHVLKMNIPHSSWSWTPNGENDYEQQNEGRYKDLIDQKLEQLINSIYPTMQDTSAAQLMYLNLIIRHVPREQLKSIVKSHLHRDGSDKLSKKGEILLDLLPTVQSPDVAHVLIDLIRDGSIRGIRARLSLGAMSLTVRPSPSVVKSLMSLYREGTTLERHTPHIRQSILLTVGTICNKMLNTMRRVGKPIPEMVSTVEEVARELTNMLEQNQSERDQIRILKAMGNMGAQELIQPLKSCIDNKNQPTIVRTQAVFALRKMAKPFDKMVHPILLSTVLDRQDKPNVRISAFVVLKKSQPTKNTLQLIGHSLRSEPSNQVKTFIYSCLVNLASHSSSVPEIQETSKHARQVLKTIRAVPVGSTDSKSVTGRLFSEEKELGARVNFWSIKSKWTGLPKTLVGSLYTTIFGNRMHLLEGGIEGSGVETVLRRVFGPYGMLKDILKHKGTWSQILESQILSPLTSRPEFGNMAEKIREFIGRKSFETRMDEEIKGLLYGEILGHEMFYRKFDKESLESLANNFMNRAPELISKLREGINVDMLKTLTIVSNSLVVPTPMGVPLSLNISGSAVLKVQGHIKANSLPSVSDFLFRRPYLSKKIEIEGSIKPSCNVEVLGYMGVNLRWIRTGTGLKGTLMAKTPIKGEVIVDPSDSKLVVKIDPPKENVQLFKAKLEPTTFTFFMPKSVENLPITQVSFKPLKTLPSIKNSGIEKRLTSQQTGFSWLLKAHWTKCTSTWCPCQCLTGKQEASLTFEPLSPEGSATKEIVIKIKKFTQNVHSGDVEDEDYSDSSRNYRLGGRDSDYEDDFEEVEKDSVISSPRKVQLFIDVDYKGYRSDKKVKAKVTWLTENNFLEHQLNVQVASVHGEDMPRFKLMLNGMFRCPINVDSYSHYVRSGEVIGKLDVHWGSSGYKERSLKCKIWELEGRTWTRELQSEGIEQDWETSDLPFTPRTLRYGLEVEVPEINHQAKNYITKTMDLVKRLLHQNVKVGIPENNQINKIEIYGQYVTKLSKLSVIVKTPQETDFFTDMQLGCPSSRYFSPSLNDQSPYTYYRNWTRMEDEDEDDFDTPDYDDYNNFRDYYTPRLNGVCKIHGDHMTTFDGTPFLLPTYGESDTSSSRCDVLLAQDCSQGGLFSITGSFKHGRWSVRTLSPSCSIEVTPQKFGDKFKVKVNGEDIRLGSSSPIIVYENQGDSSSDVACKVEKLGDGVKVKLNELKVTVVLKENNKVSVKMSPLSVMQGKLCGLCGNNNYDTDDDMTSLDNTKRFSNSRQFVMDNVLPSSTCDAGDYERQLGIRHEGFCKKEKTLKIERFMDGVEQVCFSRQPETVCRKHCFSDRQTERTVRFVCVPRDSSTCERLLEKFHSSSRYGGSSGTGSGLLTSSDLSGLSGQGTTVEEEIELPDQCVSGN